MGILDTYSENNTIHPLRKLLSHIICNTIKQIDCIKYSLTPTELSYLKIHDPVGIIDAVLEMYFTCLGQMSWC